MYFAAGSYNDAVRCFSTYIDKDPDYETIYYKLTHAMVMNDQLQESIQFNTQLTEHNPDHFLGYDNIGFAYLWSKDTLQAAPYFVEAFRRGLPRDFGMRLIQGYYIRNDLDSEWTELMSVMNTKN